MSVVAIPAFQNLDVFCHMLRFFVDDKVLCLISRVCSGWKQGVELALKQRHENVKLPEESSKWSLKERMVLSPTFVGCHSTRAHYKKYLGNPVDKENPVANLKQIDELTQPDPDSPGLMKYQTHVAVYKFTAVEKPIAYGLMAVVDELKRLQIVRVNPYNTDPNALNKEAAEKKLKVVLGPSKVEVGVSVCNMIELFHWPETSKSNGFPVVQLGDATMRYVGQASPCQTVPSIEFVRRDIPDGSFFKTLGEQLNRLPNTKYAGFLTLLIRYGFDKFEIGLSEYFCVRSIEDCFYAPDWHNPMVTRCYSLVFDTCRCVNVTSQDVNTQRQLLGLAPCITAEVEEDTKESSEPPLKKRRVGKEN